MRNSPGRLDPLEWFVPGHEYSQNNIQASQVCTTRLPELAAGQAQQGPALLTAIKGTLHARRGHPQLEGANAPFGLGIRVDPTRRIALV